jgi:hypothetical protein
MKRIALSGKNGLGKFTLVDDEDYPILSRINWTLTSHGYVRNRLFYMHSLIIGWPRGVFVIDHKDHNKLNNQKNNLRPTTSSGNMANRLKTKNKCTSSLLGVYWSTQNQRWVAQIKNTKIKKNTIYLGGFDNPHHAALVRDMWALEIFGRMAKTNFPVVKHNCF